MEWLVGSGLGVSGIGIALMVGLPPPWWPNMPPSLVSLGVATGIVLTTFGCLLMAVGACKTLDGQFCIYVISFWDYVEWKLLAPALLAAIAIIAVVVIYSRSESNPKFKIAITGVNIEHGFAENPLKSRYLITGSIENSGTPSVAKDWKLVVHSPGKEKFTARRLIIHSDSRIGVPGGGTRTLSPSLSLANQTENSEVRGTVEGYVWFETTPITSDQANNPNTTLTLSVRDKFDREHSVSVKLEDISR
jgi:hypothetical protein